VTFPAYSEYKETSAEWLGAVPSHWLLTKVKHVYRFTTGWTPPTGRSESYEGDNLWANISDLGPRFLNDTTKRISDNAVTESNMKLAPRGSLLFSFKLSIGQVSLAACDMYTNEAIASFFPAQNCDLSYAYYALPFFLPQNASENIYGAKMLNQELIRSALICFPTANEQTAIAAFLDRETAKIDALAEEQRRLIALLDEKRQAVIFQAVTKGLDPHAQTTSSGIDWLGTVPSHWIITPLKRITPSISVGIVVDPSKYVSDEGLPFIYGGDIREGSINLSKVRKISEAYSRINSKTRLSTGDLLVVRVGAPGITAVVPPSCAGGNCASVAVIRKGDFVSQWLCYAMNSRSVRYQVEIVQYGAAQEQFNISHACEFLIPLPPTAVPPTYPPP
jgi:type I restriction enzyme S subunit